MEIEEMGNEEEKKEVGAKMDTEESSLAGPTLAQMIYGPLQANQASAPA